MTARKTILFIGEAVGLAHIGRPLTLARALDPARYDIHFAFDPRYASLVAGEPNVTFHPLRTIAGQDFLSAVDNNTQSYSDADIDAYIAEELALYRAVKPGLIVADFRWTAATSAEHAKIPLATLVNSQWSPFAVHNIYEPIDQPLRMFARRARKRLQVLKRTVLGQPPPADDLDTIAFNRPRKRFGLSPMKDWFEIVCRGTYTLYTEPPDMFPMRPLPDSHVFLGPVLWAPDTPEAPWWNDLDPGRPSIYVTLGSTGAADTVPNIVREVAELPVNVLIATAGRLTLDNVPANVYVADYLPGLECARRSQVVVCNGGSATAYQGIANARPVVGLWTNPDQELTMRILQQQEAGLSHPAAKLEPGVVKAMVERAVMEGGLAKGAEKLSSQFAAYDAGVLFNRFLDRAL